MSAEALQESEIWWHGPPWLLKGKDKWPNPAVNTELLRDCYDEMRPSGKMIHSTGLVPGGGGGYSPTWAIRGRAAG